MKLTYLVRHLRQIINIQGAALLGIERALQGRCPECGEPDKHYYGCKIAKALEVSKRFKGE
jgi:hypothetical protein